MKKAKVTRTKVRHQKSVEVAKFREILITPGMVGFKVKVGCSELYFTGWMDLLEALTAYYKSPRKATEQYQLLDHRIIEPPQLPTTSSVNYYPELTMGCERPITGITLGGENV